ncbi:uncharacterized protein LOC142342364 [Convolutriloba macropyga]|uniref:uncharacterized protein LOC142342364 n=1 Tax=Convolutriloba macropyga TaxID=536237 RepID=UPI003F51BB55
MSGNRRACVDSNKLKMERIISKSYIYSEAKYVLCLIGFLFIVVHIRSVSKIPQNEDVNGRPLFAVKGTHGAKVKLYSAETLVPKPHITRKSCLDILRHSSEPYKPWMPMKGDKETFTAYLQSTKKLHNPMSYLEWGCGGSTFVALKYADQVVSIENSETWCNRVVHTDIAQCSILMGKLHFICVNAGKTTDRTGLPLDTTTYNYSLYTNIMDHFKYSPDFVFIDGRLRMATALASLKISKVNSITLVHDYYDRPGLFQDLERFFTSDENYERREKQTMAVFRRRKIIDQNEWNIAWQKYNQSLMD